MQDCSDGRAASPLQTGDGKREVQAHEEGGPLKNSNGRGELSLKAGSNDEKEDDHGKQRKTEPLQKMGEATLESHQRAGEQETKDDQVLKVERVVKVVLEAVEKTVEEMVEKMEARKVLERLELVWEDIMRMRIKLEGRGEGVEERHNNRSSAGPAAMHIELLERVRSPQRSMLSPSTQELQQAFRKVFDILSEGAGGSIDYQRFQSLLKAEGFKTNETEAQRAFRQLDRNRDGKVGFKDFWQTMSNTSLFLKFLEELPNACPACQLQKGYVSNGVVFEILLKLLTNRVISEESIGSIIHYYYWRMQKLEVKAKDSLRLKAGDALQRLSLELGVEQTGEHGDLTIKHLVGFYEAFQMLVGDHTGHILASDMLSVMYQMGIPLKNPLIPDDLKFVDFREMDFKDFLFTVTDFGTITSFLDPHCVGCKAARSPEMLPFQLLLKLLQTPLVEAQCRAIVMGYFQEKFRASLPPRQSRERGVLVPCPDGGSPPTVGTHKWTAAVGSENGRLGRHQDRKRFGRSTRQQYFQGGVPGACKWPRKSPD